MPLQPTIQMVINEKRSRDALHVQLQWRWRGFNRHRSEEGADRLRSIYTGHKGVLGSRRYFIFVRTLTPQGRSGYGPPGSRITTITLYSLEALHFQSVTQMHYHIHLPLRRIPVNGYPSSGRKTGKQAMGENKTGKHLSTCSTYFLNNMNTFETLTLWSPIQTLGPIVL